MHTLQQNTEGLNVYHTAGKFGKETVWRIYSFQEFGKKSLAN